MAGGVAYERRVLTAADVQTLAPGTELWLSPGTRVTPLAQDEASKRGVTLQVGTPPGPAAAATAHSASFERTIALGADHGGFELKQQLNAYLAELGYATIDVGCHSRDPVDYPDIAYAAARLVATGSAAAAIIIDGAGIGSAMAANKVPGVRAALCYDISSARNSREHNHANVLTLGAGLIGPALARQIVQAWLETPWGTGRHARRVDKITQIERRYAKGE